MKPKLITTKQEHEAALKRIERLMGAKPGTPKADELELLAALVDLYEKEHFPMKLLNHCSPIAVR